MSTSILSFAQTPIGRLPTPVSYKGKIKPVLLKETRIATQQAYSLDIKSIKRTNIRTDLPITDVEEPVSKEALAKLQKLENIKAVILSKKMKQKANPKFVYKGDGSDKGGDAVTKQVTRESSGCPPDNTVAVSQRGFVVAADNRELGFYDNDGNELASFNYTDFYEPVRAGLGEDVCDPKVIYDYESDRFVFFTQAFSDNTSKSECLLAFSKSQDPRDGWFVYVFHQFRDKEKNWFDYPGLAYNEKEVFLCGNLFGPGDADNVIFQFDKSDGYAGQNMNGLMWLDVKQANGDDASTILPLQTIPNFFYEKDMLFVSITSGGGSNCYYYRINNRINNNPQMSKHEINIPDYELPTKVSQKETSDKLDGGRVKVRGGLFVDNMIYFAFCKPDAGGFDGIALTRIRISDFAIKTKYFNDNQNSEYNYPNLAHRGTSPTDHRLLLVYQRSGINHWPQVRYRKIKSNMSADGSSVTIQSSENFREECDDDRGARWGDYIGIQRQGKSNNYWVMGHTGNSSNKWRSHLIKIGL